jgi:serine/threonine protein phosphatase 1
MDRIGGTKLRWEHIEPDVQRPHFSGKTVVVGHTPQVGGEVLDLCFLVCIDTDCSRGGWLTALDVETGRVIQANQRGPVRESHCRGEDESVLT